MNPITAIVQRNLLNYISALYVHVYAGDVFVSDEIYHERP